jgi:hypothetical protein
LHAKTERGETVKHNFWTHWLKVCGIIAATATALSAIYYVFAWKAGVDASQKLQDARIDDTKSTISKIDSKLDKVANDTSEIKGSVQTLLEMQKRQQGGEIVQR